MASDTRPCNTTFLVDVSADVGIYIHTNISNIKYIVFMLSFNLNVVNTK